MIAKAGPFPRRTPVPASCILKLRRLSSKEWWEWTFREKDVTKAEWKTLQFLKLDAWQWVDLHTACNGRPPWRDAKVHIYHKLVCRGCGQTLVWSDQDAQADPWRYEANVQ